MKSINKTIPIAAILVLLIAGMVINAQDAARLHFEKLNSLETKARDVVEVNVDGKLLDLAKRVTGKVKDDDAKKVAAAISGLKGIYVRVYNFEKENEYNVADVDEVRTQLGNPGWEKLANVRSKKNNQKVDVYTMFSGDKMDGMAVVLSESKTVAVVNVIGMIDIETLIELSGKMNIPRIDIETKPKNEEE
jgi:hypothetical protein